jgi:cysteine-rich repeat protein
MDDNDACVTGCVAAVCGDGFVNVGVEECDDGGMMALDGCSPNCMLEARLAFATSTLHDGNLGGLMGADTICNMRAQEAGLPGTYMAWLSTNEGSPATRFVQSMVPYFTVTGIKIADNWTDLVDATLDASLQIDQWGAPSPIGTNVCVVNNVQNNRTAFTGTGSNGLPNGGSCTNFTSNVGPVTVGVTTSATFRWTNCAQLSCANTSAIYCFQQQ